ncbi:MAG: NAD-dependent epimerase/dehydratase family protein [Patescibacteria group bacterium]
MQKLAIITGGAGFIGSHLVDALIAKKWKVEIIDNLSSGRRENVNPKAKLHVMDIREPEAAKLILKLKPHAVFHLAAQVSVPESIKDPVYDAEVNIHATLRLLEASSVVHVTHFIFAGTGGALSSEKTKLPTDEEHAIRPESPYGIAKFTSEMYGDFYRHVRGLPFVSFRFANVYGPRQTPKGEACVVAVFIKRMLKGEPVRINGSGKQTRDYIFVDDVVRAMLFGLTHPEVEGPFNVGTGHETDVWTLFRKLSKIAGYDEKPLAGPADVGAPFRSVLDSKKANQKLGWKPKVSLDQGLKKTVEWLEKEKGK